jgi:hypothetical protein
LRQRGETELLIGPRKGLGFIDLSGRGDRRHINLSHFIYRLPRIASISSNQRLFLLPFVFLKFLIQKAEISYSA